MRDCRILSIFEGTNEILRMLIALSGIRVRCTALFMRLLDLGGILLTALFCASFRLLVTASLL
jgi:hypothetical protein